MKVQSYVENTWLRGWYGHEHHYGSSYTASFSGTLGNNSLVSSGKNLNIYADNLTNNSGGIYALNNMSISAINFVNYSNFFEAYYNIWHDWWGCCSARDYTYSIKPTNTIYVTDSYPALVANRYIGWDLYTSDRYVLSVPAFIKSGASLTITKSNTNVTSTFLNGDNVAQNTSVSNPNYRSQVTQVSVS